MECQSKQDVILDVDCLDTLIVKINLATVRPVFIERMSIKHETILDIKCHDNLRVLQAKLSLAKLYKEQGKLDLEISLLKECLPNRIIPKCCFLKRILNVKNHKEAFSA